MVILSHLSDLQIEMCMKQSGHGIILMTNKTNFIKFLLMKYPKTDKEINLDMEWEMFASQHLNQEPT